MKIKNIIHNIKQNFYCDIVMIISNKISFINKVLFLFNKYSINIIKIILNKKKFILFWKSFYVYNNLGILNYQIMFKDFYDFYDLKLWNNLVIFDVWANIGDFALVSNNYYKNSNIFCFEPIKYTFWLLEKNCNPYNNIKTYKLWLGDKKEKLKFFFTEEESDRGSFSKDNFNSWNIKEEDVNISTLDSFCEQEKIIHIDILKIDVEWFEYNVLMWWKEMLKNTKNIIIECHLNKNEDGFFKIYNFLKDYGFKFKRLWKIWYDNKTWNMQVFDAIFYKK